jgi:hypothetical protein
MDSEQIEKNILRLKNEILELKETLADSYILSSIVEEQYLKKDAILDYFTKVEGETIKSSIQDINTKYDNLNSVLTTKMDEQDLSIYVKKDDYTVSNNTINNEITSLQEELSQIKNTYLNNDYYTKNEVNDIVNQYKVSVDNKGYLTTDDITNLPTKEWIKSQGYLTEQPDLTDYVKIDDVYTQSEIDNKGFITSHQDLSGYVKQSDLSGYVKQSDITDYITKKNVNNLLSSYVRITDLDLSDFVKHSDISDLLSININEYTTKEAFEKYKLQISSKNYVTREYINTYLFPYVKKVDLDKMEYVDEDTVNSLITKSISKINIPTKLSELTNDKGYLTEHQSLKGYVKKTDLANFITLDDTDERYLKITDFILPEGIVYHDDIQDLVSVSMLNNYMTTGNIYSLLSNYVTSSQIKGYVTKTSLLNELNNYVTSSELEKYVSKSDNTLSSDVVLKSDLSNYVTSSQLGSYVKQTDLKTTLKNYVLSSSLKSYVTKNDLSLLKDSLDDYAKLSDLSNLLTLENENKYVKYSDLNLTNGTEFVDYLSKFITQADVKNTLDTQLSKYTLKTDLKSYVTKNDLSLVKDSLDDYAKLSDLSNLLTESEFTKKYSKYLTNDTDFITKLNQFLTKDDVSTLVSSQLSKYTLKTDLKSYVTKNDLSLVKDSLDDYAKLSDLSNLLTRDEITDNFVRYTDINLSNGTEFISYLSKFLTKDDISNLVTSDDLNDYTTKKELKKYAKLSDLEDYVTNSTLSDYVTKKSYNKKINEIENKYLTKDDAILNYLSKDDYRGIKGAATLNYSFNEDPDTFWNFVVNKDGYELNDGFYVVENKVYVIKSNKVISFADQTTSGLYWEIETD